MLLRVGIIALLTSTIAIAQEKQAYTVPIEWQKVELQEKIEKDINESVGAIVEKSKFIVHVALGVSAAKTFGANQRQEKGKGKKGGNFPLSKLGLNKNSRAYKKAISVSDDSVFNRLNRVTVNLSLDRTVSRQKEAQAKQLIATVVKSYTLARLGVSVKRLKFVSDENIRARNLEVARVNIDAAKAIGVAITESNTKIAEAIASAQGVATTTTADGETKIKSVNQLPTDWKEILVLFRLPIGIILATLILAMLISGFKKFESQKVALMAQSNTQAKNAAEQAQNSNAEEAAAPEVKEEAEVHAVAVGGASLGASESGFDQFRKISEQYVDTSAYLIKTWLNMDTPESRQALSALTKMVPVESLVASVESLDQDLKLKLKKASMSPIDAGSIQKAENFIIDQMVDNFLVNTIVLPEALKETLSGMTMQEAVQVIKANSQFSGCFLNVMQTGQVARLLSMLSEDEVSTAFEQGLRFNSESIQFLESSLASALESIRVNKSKTRVPLIDKAIELIKVVGAEKESDIFNMLISSGEHGQVIEAAGRYFPSELILTLPPEIIRILVNRLPMQKRAGLIVTRSDEDQKILFSAIGDTGRLREIIDTEINEINRNDKMKVQLVKDHQKIWDQFLTSSREAIRTDSRIKDVAEDVLEKWLLEKGVDTQKEQNEQAA